MIDCKKFVETLNDKPVALFGLGLSGLSTVKALVKAGATVWAWDDNIESREAAKKLGADLRELTSDTMARCACLVLAPGVPLHFPKPHPVVNAATAAGIEIIGDLEILHRTGHGAKVIGITGTNGKSTTTALIGHILESAGLSVSVGGNIGKPVLELDVPKKNGFFVLEISSYQMDLCPSFRPDISVLLNITPDHLDRHGNFENYTKAKERIFEGEGLAVISLDDQQCCKIYDRLKKGSRRIRTFSSEGAVDDGNYVANGVLFDAREGEAREIGSLNGLTNMRGRHNHQNAAAAYTVRVSKDIGMKPDEILQHMTTFSGLPHRQHQVRVINGIPYINDSKATNAEAASKALAAYRNIYWIAGGRPKGGGLNDLQPYIQNMSHVFLLGEAMVGFAGWLDQYAVPYTFCGDLKTAIEEAHTMAQAERGKPGGGGVVLLSPACASFDQFKSFEERGNLFTDIVMNIAEDGKDEVAA